MWLLDANMPVQLVALLKDLGIEADSAVARGWNTLSNGSLVRAAARAKFTVLLTRDRLFGESAAGALRTNGEFCIVPVTLRHPIRVSEIATMLREAAWNPGAMEDLSADYTRWYATFIERIQRKQREIEEVGGVESYRFVLSMYSGLRDVIASGTLGGAIVHALAD